MEEIRCAPEWTPQQLAIFQWIERAQMGQQLVIEAMAGTGKTTTLIECIRRAQPRKSLYLAFNRSIAVDAEQRLFDVEPRPKCKTFHALAYEYIIRRSNEGTETDPKPIYYTLEQKSRVIQDAALILFAGKKKHQDHLKRNWHMIEETLKHFCHSTHGRPVEHHIPGFSPNEPFARVPETIKHLFEGQPPVFIPQVAKQKPQPVPDDILQVVFDLWTAMKQGHLPLTFPALLRIFCEKFQSNKVRLGDQPDFVLVDEAQDLLPIVRQWVTQGPWTLILVGDSCQAINGWTGAVNALQSQNFQTADRLHLTASWRFGSDVATTAMAVLRAYQIPSPELEGKGHQTLVHARAPLAWNPDAILGRRNSDLIRKAIQLLENGSNYHLARSFREWIESTRELAQLKVECEWKYKSRHKKAHDLDDVSELAKFNFIDEQPNAVVILRKVLDHDSPHSARPLLATVHSTKGQEWDCVELLEGCLPLIPSLPMQEVYLAYVALTRAKEQLVTPFPPWLSNVLSDNHHPRTDIVESTSHKDEQCIQTESPSAREEVCDEDGSSDWIAIESVERDFKTKRITIIVHHSSYRFIQIEKLRGAHVFYDYMADKNRPPVKMMNFQFRWLVKHEEIHIRWNEDRWMPPERSDIFKFHKHLPIIVSPSRVTRTNIGKLPFGEYVIIHTALVKGKVAIRLDCKKSYMSFPMSKSKHFYSSSQYRWYMLPQDSWERWVEKHGPKDPLNYSLQRHRPNAWAPSGVSIL